MKITCNTDLLTAAAQNVQRATSTKTSLPAAEGILLKADASEKKLYLTGYDLDVGVKTALDVSISEPGEIVLNARILCDILRRLPAETVEIEADERQLCVIHSGEMEYKLVGIDAAEFPELPVISDTTPVLVDAKVLGDMIRRTIFATSTNESKKVHTGVKFELSPNKLQLAAVDGFRLAVRTEVVNYTGPDLSFIVPAKTLSEVTKLLADEDVVSLNVASRHIIFEIGSYSVISRLLDGEFLDYKAAIPKKFGTTVTVDVKTMESSIERTSLLITDRLKSPLRCVFDGNTIKISSTTTLGAASDRIPAKVEGERVEIGFNQPLPSRRVPRLQRG